MQAIRAEIARLRETADREANRLFREFIRNSGRDYAPSRVMRSRVKQDVLIDVRNTAWRTAITKRLAQLDRLDRKAWRLCGCNPDHWPRHSTDELALPLQFDTTL